MIEMNKTSETEVSQAILALYKNTRKVNTIAGNGALVMDRFDTQLENVKSELKETIDGLAENNLVEVVDGCCDLLVTLSELVMIMDGNESLLANPPMYLNMEGFTVETLIDCIKVDVHNGNYIDALGYTEDLAFQLNANMVHNCNSVAVSNLSKFIKLKELQDTEFNEEYLIKDLESKGRYPDVYAEHVEFEGDIWVVLKANYDKKNDEKYPLGKFLKIGLTFVEPEIVTYG